MAAVTMTKRKTKWVPRKGDIVKGDPINPPLGVASSYAAEMRALIDVMSAEVEAEIRDLFKQPEFAMDASPSAQARILTNALIKKFTERFNGKAKSTAEKFTRRANKANESAVKSSIQKMAGDISLPAAPFSPEVQDILSAIVTENVSLIKSIGQQYLGQVQQSVMRSIAQGTDITGLVKELQRHKGVSLRRAKIIAFDQTHKISNALSRARFMNAGITKYVWRHTGGSNEPRPLHVKYDGRTFRYDTPVKVQDDPVVYGYPGTLINCSCRQQPVVEFREEG